MIAIDTNILFPSLEPSHKAHREAREFLLGMKGGEIGLCELVLMETYVVSRIRLELKQSRPSPR